MKNINYLTIIFISVLTVSCSKSSDPSKKIGIGSRTISYQSDKKVGSLMIPPDLTQPNIQGVFAEEIRITKDSEAQTELVNVEVARDNYRRWLIVDKPQSEVWALTKEFFRSYNFKIEKENQQIGIFETDYLEIETKVPDKSLGMIRAALSKALKTQYGLPIADKYRVRIEAANDPNKTEVYLTLSSIGEVVSGTLRLWQPREKDIEIETEMLLTLMVFIGSNESDAISKILNVEKEKQESVYVRELKESFATLVFPYNKKQTWSYLGWALDELNIDIEDRDPLEGSYYINISTSVGFFSGLLNTVSNGKTYKLTVREKDASITEVIFVDLTEENKLNTINYSYEFFNEIASKF